MVYCAAETVSTPLKPRLLLELGYCEERGKMWIEKTRQTASSPHQLVVTVLHVICPGLLQPADLAETWK